MKKYAIYLILTICIVFTLASCSSNSTSSPLEAEGEPSVDDSIFMSEVPVVFESEDEFLNSFSRTRSYGGVSYFKPDAEEALELDYIRVRDSYIAFSYQIPVASPLSDHVESSTAPTIYFEWLTTIDAENLESEIRRVFYPEHISQYNDYIIVYDETSQTEKEIYWTQDGYSFHANVPDWFGEYEIETYCVAKAF